MPDVHSQWPKRFPVQNYFYIPTKRNDIKTRRTDSVPFITPLNTLGLGFNQNSLTSPSLNSNETVEFFKLAVFGGNLE